MHVFNDIIDRVIEATSRSDKKQDIVMFANSVIQQIHSKMNWERDLQEARALNKYPACKLVWPRPRNFRKMALVRINGEKRREAEHVRITQDFISRIDWDYYYYADEHFVFCGSGINHVDIAYYGKPPAFKYYENGQTPACWDETLNNGEGGWKYLTPDKQAYALGLGKTEKEYWARYVVTNWLIDEYFTVIYWGVVNQLAALTMDEELKRNSYSAFQTLLADLKRSEVHVSAGY